MESESDADPLTPTAAPLPTVSADAGTTTTRPCDGVDARDEAPEVRPAVEGGVDRVLEKLDEFLAEIERTLAALVTEVAPAA